MVTAIMVARHDNERPMSTRRISASSMVILLQHGARMSWPALTCSAGERVKLKRRRNKIKTAKVANLNKGFLGTVVRVTARHHI